MDCFKITDDVEYKPVEEHYKNMKESIKNDQSTQCNKIFVPWKKYGRNYEGVRSYIKINLMKEGYIISDGYVANGCGYIYGLYVEMPIENV